MDLLEEALYILTVIQTFDPLQTMTVLTFDNTILAILHHAAFITLLYQMSSM